MFWEMKNIRSLASLPGTLWPRMAALDRVLSMGQIEIFLDFESLVFCI